MSDLDMIEFEIAGVKHCLPIGEANEKLIAHIGAEMLKLAQRLSDEGLSRDQINEQLARALPDYQRWMENIRASWSGLLIRRDETVH